MSWTITVFFWYLAIVGGLLTLLWGTKGNGSLRLVFFFAHFCWAFGAAASLLAMYNRPDVFPTVSCLTAGFVMLACAALWLVWSTNGVANRVFKTGYMTTSLLSGAYLLQVLI